MRETLFLFTYTFPFGSAESFLETEIGYLAEEWERIVVLPARLEGEARAVPANVELETGLAGELAGGYLARDVAAAMADGEFFREVLRDPAIVSRPGYLRRLLGQVAVARSTARWIERHLLRKSSDERPPLFYSYWMNNAALGLARLKRCRRALAFVTRAHGYDLYAERHATPYLPLQHEIVRRADAVFTISEHGRSYLGRKYPEMTSRVELARLGVPDPQSGGCASSDGRWRVLSCSGLLPVKRIELLLQGIAELARRNSERTIDWDHLGDGPERPAIEASALASFPQNVRWTLHGQVANTAVIEYYRSRPVDVLVNVSESEGIPVSIMEAESFGVPVVATAVGGVPEIVDASNGALLSPAVEPRVLADAIELVCRRGQADSHMREASRRMWRERYDADRNYSAFVSRLKEIHRASTQATLDDPLKIA